MASHSYIFELEGDIEMAREAITNATTAYKYECQTTGTCRVSPENRDVWGTLHTNVLLLESCVKALLELTKKEFPS